MMSERKSPLTSSIYLLTVFLSAFLLFQVQPLISKFILPWFGGSPAVWTTCMLFFQMVLLAGYIYAHVVVKKLSPKKQAGLHILLLVAATSVLPIIPDSAWKPTDASDPSGRIILLLGVAVGLPYFVLSTTGPLLQGWYFRTLPGSSPYRLYSLSNIGSLLALLSYPFAVEPNFATENQALVWSWTFYVFAGCCGLCGLLMATHLPDQVSATETSPQPGEAKPIPSQSEIPQPTSSTPTLSQRLLWFALAAVPSVMLLATTNQVCTDLAVVPFLWVLPLSLYLITFILCFDSDRWYSRSLFSSLMLLFMAGATFVLWDSAANWQFASSVVLQASVFFGLLFCSCMVCHGELERLKPHPDHLTTFYLSISAGGAMGGLFVGLVAPRLFDTHFELHLGMIASCVLLMIVVARDPNSLLRRPGRAVAWLLMLGFVGGLGWALDGQANRVTRNALAIERNFYGVVRVDRYRHSFRMKHGHIRHGHQFVDASLRHLPTTYYGHASGAGVVLAQHKPRQSKRVGVIGLGAGTLAAYANPGDYYRLYEINPAVVRMAEEYFTYLSDCKGKYEHVIGDARIMMENESPQQFDVLVLDAFSGDAVPTHLLTMECCEIYLKHLNSDGILAFHVTNRHVDLRPICQGLADHFGLECMGTYSAKERELGTQEALWVLMSRKKESLAGLKLTDTFEVEMGARPILWTDTWSNLLSVMGFGTVTVSLKAK